MWISNTEYYLNTGDIMICHNGKWSQLTSAGVPPISKEKVLELIDKMLYQMHPIEASELKEGFNLEIITNDENEKLKNMLLSRDEDVQNLAKNLIKSKWNEYKSRL